MKPLILALTLTMGGCYVIIGGAPPSTDRLSDAIKVCEAMQQTAEAANFQVEILKGLKGAMTNIMVFSTL